MGNTPQIEGADEVVNWFGYWPTFHDAEVLSIILDRGTGARVALHVFKRGSDLDSEGSYMTSKHAVITFTLNGFPLDAQGVVNTRIEYLNHQNVVAEAAVHTLLHGYALIVHGVFGVTAQICGESISVSVQPGRPC
jgi:hypothetical protein